MVELLNGAFHFYKSDGLNIVLKRREFKKERNHCGKIIPAGYVYVHEGFFGTLPEVFTEIIRCLQFHSVGTEDDVVEMRKIKTNLIKLKEAVVDETKRCVREYYAEVEQRKEDGKGRGRKRKGGS